MRFSRRVLLMRVPQAVKTVTIGLLVIEQRVGAVLGPEQLENRLPLALERGRNERLDVLLHRAVPRAVEGSGDLLGQGVVAGLELLHEPLPKRASVALEFRPHVVDVGRRLLAVQDPGADLHRLRDGLSRALPGLGALAHDPCGALVGDGQPLDHEAVVERPDDAVAVGHVEGELWLLRGFHRTLEGSRAAPTES